MQIIPVLDLKGGVVVRGVAGRREEYQPILSRITSSCEPLTVAQAFRQHFGLDELYLADLDAIAGAPPLLPLYALLREQGFHLWVDAGIRHAALARSLVTAGVQDIVVGMETVASLAALAEILREHGEQVIFSLDLRQGVSLGDTSTWERGDPWSIAIQAIASGVRRLLVLDLARVGMGSGTGTEELCRRLTTLYPNVAVAAGGGVRGPADLQRLAHCGVSAVLVASALHDGRLRIEDLAQL